MKQTYDFIEDFKMRAFSKTLVRHLESLYEKPKDLEKEKDSKNKNSK